MSILRLMLFGSPQIWWTSFAGKVKLLVLIGQTREKIADCAEKHGFEDILFAETFEEAFRSCVEHAAPGDAVLLSPACASWGQAGTVA